MMLFAHILDNPGYHHDYHWNDILVLDNSPEPPYYNHDDGITDNGNSDYPFRRSSESIMCGRALRVAPT